MMWMKIITQIATASRKELAIIGPHPIQEYNKDVFVQLSSNFVSFG